jgi:hypothetical protein
VTGGAGARHFAGMLDFNFMTQQLFTDALAGFSLD